MSAELGLRARSLAEFVIRWGLGWRYLLSRRFRRQVHARWADRSKQEVAIDVTALIIAFVTLNGLLVLIGMWSYDEILAAWHRSPEI
jgi:hypothetical protein